MATKEILLYSAGADSFPVWHYLGKPPALYFDIGHRYRNHEHAAVDTLTRRCGITLTVSRELDLVAWEESDGIIPLRNIYFALLASHRADTIWCIGVKGDHTADKSPTAFARISQFVSEFIGREVRVDSPFWDMTKTEIIRWYLDQGLPVEDLLDTFSCLDPGTSSLHCGRCSACLRRWISFANNGIDARFAANPWEWEQVHSFYMTAMHDGTYPQHRAEEFFAALATVGVHTYSNRPETSHGRTIVLTAYIAAPLFNEAEKTFNLTVDAALRAAGVSTYLPQHDGVPVVVLGVQSDEFQQLLHRLAHPAGGIPRPGSGTGHRRWCRRCAGGSATSTGPRRSSGCRGAAGASGVRAGG